MLIDGDDVETNGVSIHGDDGNRTESDTAQCMYYMYYYVGTCSDVVDLVG